jgi:hypothetical protein
MAKDSKSSEESSSSEDSMNGQVKKQGKRFSWAAHEQTLKDIIKKHKLWEPNSDQLQEISGIMKKNYKIDNVDAEKLRAKFRTKTFNKWINSQKQKSRKGKVEKKIKKEPKMNSKKKKGRTIL